MEDECSVSSVYCHLLLASLCSDWMVSVSLAVFLLAVGMTCRLTRFITKDTLAAGIRSWIAGRFGDESRAAYLVNCGWCTSIWASGVTVIYALLLSSSLWFQVPATALTLSYIAGVAGRWVD